MFIFIFKAFWFILTDSDNTHINYITFKAYKRTNKIFFIKFFLYIKITNNYYQKHKEKPQKEAGDRYQSLSEEEKTKSENRSEKDIKI